MTTENAADTSSPLAALQSMSCPYCGSYPKHSVEQCARVAAIEYHPNFGGIKRIEFR